MVEARAAFGFGKGHAGQAKLGGFLEDFAREPPRLIELLGERLHFALGEFAHGALQQRLLFGQVQIHGCSPRPRRRGGMDGILS